MYRRIQTHLWTESWFTELDADQKLLYLYLITGPTQRQCGVFKANMRRIEFDTGIGRDRLSKAFEALRPYVLVHGPTLHVAVLHYMQHQDCGAKWRRGSEAQRDALPDEVRLWLADEEGKAIDRLSKATEGYPAVAVAVAVAVPEAVTDTDGHSAPSPPQLEERTAKQPPTNPNRRKDKAGARVTAKLKRVADLDALYRVYEAVYHKRKIKRLESRTIVFERLLGTFTPVDIMQAIIGFQYQDYIVTQRASGLIYCIRLDVLFAQDDAVDEGIALFRANRSRAMRHMPVDYCIEHLADWRDIKRWQIPDRLVGVNTGKLTIELGEDSRRWRAFCMELFAAYEAGTLDAVRDDLRQRWQSGGIPQTTEPTEYTMDIAARLGG